MLKLKGITKIYDVADERVAALRGVDIEFRESEFVSILGPSGCGKTTLLNIIGGLDDYTEGDIAIGGVGTMKRILSAFDVPKDAITEILSEESFEREFSLVSVSKSKTELGDTYSVKFLKTI